MKKKLTGRPFDTRLKIFTALLLIFAAVLSACTHVSEDTSAAPEQTEPLQYPLEELQILFADVGKADFMLLSCGEKYMIIDSGYKKNKDRIFEILDEHGVKTIEYAVATHADKDHIGSMADIIKHYNVKNLIISNFESTEALYKKMLTAARNNGCSVTRVACGDSFRFAGALFKVLSPDDTLLQLNDENEASVVLMMSYGKRKVLFAADALYLAEDEMRNNSDIDLSADVIKIGHHGSAKASTEGFIRDIGAQYAVISTATEDVPYPAQLTLDTLEKYNVTVYRTDTDGDITLKTDGESLDFTLQNIGLTMDTQ